MSSNLNLFYLLLTRKRLHPHQILCPPQKTHINFNHVRSTESFELAEEQVGLLLDCSKSDSSRLTTHNQARSVKERGQTTEIDRQRIWTALELGHSVRHISEKMGFSQKQIDYVKKMELLHDTMNVVGCLKYLTRKRDKW